jgi:hypothetical protein
LPEAGGPVVSDNGKTFRSTVLALWSSDLYPAAVIQLDSLAAGLARQSPAVRAQARPAPQSPAEVLAALLDFSGSVALAELLEAPTPNGPPHPLLPRSARKLEDTVRVQLDAIAARALKRLAQEPEAARAFPPDVLLQRIERTAHGRSSRVPTAAAAERLARDLGAPLHAALGTCVRRVQADFAALRAQIAPELRALGPRAEKLERIDAALQLGMQAKLGGLFERLVLAAELAFQHACVETCAGLHEDFSAAQLASWVGPDGWIARHRTRCERMLLAFCGHLRRALEGLLQASIQAESAE